MRVTVITGKCKHDVLISSHLAAGVIHSFPTPPAVGPPTPPTDTRALSNSRLAAVYLWLVIAKAVSHCPGRLKLFDAAKMRGAHTHIMVASSSFSRLSVARSGETWHDMWQINCRYRISHVHDLQWGGGLSDRCGWPDGATDYCLPSIGTITKKSIGPIPIPPNTGKHWPIPNTPIPVSFEP